MEQFTAIGLDVAVVVTIAVCIYGAAKKGFLRTVIQMAAYIGILMVSTTVARVAAPVVYTRVVEPALFERYQVEGAQQENSADTADEQKDNADLVSLRGENAAGSQLVFRSGTDAAQVRQVALTAGTSSPLLMRTAFGAILQPERDTPEEPQDEPTESQPDATNGQDSGQEAVRGVIDEVLDQLGESGAKYGALLRERLAALDLDQIDLGTLDLESLGLDDLTRENAGDFDALIPPELREEIMREITNQTVRPAVIGALQVVCFAVTFGVLSVVANLLLMALGVVRYLPLIGRINAFFGGIVGLCQGLLLVWVAALLLYGVLQLCGGSWWIFSNDLLEQSFLFRYFIIPGVLGS